MFIQIYQEANDSRILCKFGLYKNAQYRGLFNVGKGFGDAIPSYSLGDKGQILQSMDHDTLQRRKATYNLKKLLYDRKHKRGRSIMHNAFDI